MSNQKPEPQWRDIWNALIEMGHIWIYSVLPIIITVFVAYYKDISQQLYHLVRSTIMSGEVTIHTVAFLAPVIFIVDKIQSNKQEFPAPLVTKNAVILMLILSIALFTILRMANEGNYTLIWIASAIIYIASLCVWWRALVWDNFYRRIDENGSEVVKHGAESSLAGLKNELEGYEG